MSDIFAVIVPQENVNDASATIVEWNIMSGTNVKKGDVIVTLETMKGIFEIEAEEDGFLFHEIVEGTEVTIGSEIAYICEENKRPEIKMEGNGAEKGREYNGEVNISTKARKLMKEYGLHVEDFTGLEKIKLADVETRVAEKKLKKRIESVRGIINQKQTPYEEAIISSSKRFEIQQLGESYKRVVPSSVSLMIDMKKVEKITKDTSARDGVQATIVELVIFEIAQLLKKYNIFNGFYDNGNCIIYNEINIGFAVNIGKGLKVPVIKNVDRLSLKDVSNSVKDLSLKYFRGELRLGDLSGGTFTVTDLSAKGIIDFYPVINNMQAAILGICSVMPGTNHFKVILTFDHNMSDGMVAADMLNELSTLLHGT